MRIFEQLGGPLAMGGQRPPQTPRVHGLAFFGACGGFVALAAGSCFDSGTRWEGTPPTQVAAVPDCTIGDQRCALGAVETTVLRV